MKSFVNSKSLGIIFYFAAALLLIFPGPAAFLGLVLLLGQTTMRRVRTGHWLPHTPMNLAIGLLVGMAFIGLLVSPVSTLSLNRICVFILGVATFYTIFDLASAPGNLRWVTIGLVLFGIAIGLASLVLTDWSIGALLSPFDLVQRLPVLLHLPGSGVPNLADGIHPRAVAATMAMLTPLALSLAIWGQGKRLRLLGILAVLVMAFPLILSQSPQGYLGLAIGIGLIFAWYAPRTLMIQAALGLLALLAWLGRAAWLSAPMIARLEYGIWVRFSIWRRGFWMLQDMPFSGSGLNAFPTAIQYYGAPSDPAVPHAHNVFLQTANDQGILGMLALVVLLALVFRAGWSVWRSAQRAAPRPDVRVIVLGCAGGCAAFVGYGLWDATSLGSKPALLLWAMMGLLATAASFVNSPHTGLSSRLRRATLLLLLLLVVVFSPIWSSALMVNLGRISLHRAFPGSSNLVEPLAKWAIRLWPQNGRAYALAGLNQVQHNQDQAGVISLEHAISLGSHDPYIYLNLGQAYQRLGQREQAAQCWLAAGEASSALQAGLQAETNGDLQAAEYWFSLVLQINPNLASARSQLGNIEYQLSRQAAERGDFVVAEQYSRRAVEHSPQNGLYLAWLGDLYRQQGHFAQALEQYDLVIRQAKNTEWVWRAHQRQGSLWAEQEEWERAIEEYQVGVEISRQQGTAPDVLAQNLALLGDVLLKADRVAEARLVFQQALAIDPTNVLAQQRLEQTEGH